MTRALLVVMCVALAASACIAAEEATKAQPKSNASSTVTKAPHYNPVAERAKFFTAAGKDSELDAKEFAVAQGKPNSFVRKTDTWDALVKFDKNGNKTIDWFEADAYRRGQQAKPKATITTIDGKPIQPDQRPDSGRGGDDRGRGRGGWTPDPETLKKFDKNGNGQIDGEERRAYYEARRAEYQKRMLEQYDKNKDGKIDDDERKAMYEAYRARRAEEQKKRHFERFDADKDGKLNAEEQAALEKHEAEHRERDAREQAQREKRRAEFMKIHDKDGDGELSEKEREGIREYYRKRMEERRAEALKKYDKDGDGKLSDEERREMYRAFRSRRGRGRGPGGPGGPRPGGPRPEGGPRPDRGPGGPTV